LLALGLADDTLIDKGSMAKAAAAVGLATPEGRTYGTLAELRDDVAALPYPAVIKPSISRFTAKRVDRPADVERIGEVEGPFLVQPFIDAPLRSIGGVMWEGRMVAAVHQRYLRTWPARCGGASAAETTGPDQELEERTLELLGEHAGIFHVQLAGDLLLDVNPRVYGSLPLAQRAGVNLVGLTCDLLRGSAPPPAVLRGAPGIFYRSLEGDLRNRLHELRRGRIGVVEAVSSLLPRRNAAHGPESLKDPGPMIARARFAASRVIRRTP
jgi:predicted ATP-grasp superfamily ATP-dependent carboligase